MLTTDELRGRLRRPFWLRVTDEERNAAAQALNDAYSAGLIDSVQLGERSAKAAMANRVGQLRRLLKGLDRPPAPPARPGVATPAPYAATPYTTPGQPVPRSAPPPPAVPSPPPPAAGGYPPPYARPVAPNNALRRATFGVVGLVFVVVVLGALGPGAAWLVGSDPGGSSDSERHETAVDVDQDDPMAIFADEPLGTLLDEFESVADGRAFEDIRISSDYASATAAGGDGAKRQYLRWRPGRDISASGSSLRSRDRGDVEFRLGRDLDVATEKLAATVRSAPERTGLSDPSEVSVSIRRTFGLAERPLRATVRLRDEADGEAELVIDAAGAVVRASGPGAKEDPQRFYSADELSRAVTVLRERIDDRPVLRFSAAGDHVRVTVRNEESKGEDVYSYEGGARAWLSSERAGDSRASETFRLSEVDPRGVARLAGSALEAAELPGGEVSSVDLRPRIGPGQPELSAFVRADGASSTEETRFVYAEPNGKVTRVSGK